jgi:membrane-anchored glycerophosphoryl diester phosphodiesterase (GDPDase)
LAYIEKPRKIMSALQESWNRTEGEVLNVFIALLVFGLVVMAVVYVVSIPTSIYSVMYIGGAGLSETADDLAAMNVMSGMFSDPIYLLLSVLTIVAGAWASIAQSFYMVSIYDSLKVEEKREVKKKVNKVVTKKKKVKASKKK